MKKGGNSNKKWTITLIILPFSVFINSTSSAAEKVELGLAETGPASWAYNLVAGVAENTNTKTNLVRITAETTAGFEENVRLLGRGETEPALFGGTQAYQGLRGIGPYKGEPPYKDIRGIVVAYGGNITWNARQGINKLLTSRGKRSVLVPREV